MTGVVGEGEDQGLVKGGITGIGIDPRTDLIGREGPVEIEVVEIEVLILGANLKDRDMTEEEIVIGPDQDLGDEGGKDKIETSKKGEEMVKGIIIIITKSLIMRDPKDCLEMGMIKAHQRLSIASMEEIRIIGNPISQDL